MKTVTIVYDVVTYQIRRIDIDATSKLATNERSRTMSLAAYKQLGSRAEIAKALGLQ